MVLSSLVVRVSVAGHSVVRIMLWLSIRASIVRIGHAAEVLEDGTGVLQGGRKKEKKRIAMCEGGEARDTGYAQLNVELRAGRAFMRMWLASA